VEEYTKRAITAEQKLEAVKKFVEKGPCGRTSTLQDYLQAVDDWLGKLMNILEEDEG